MSKGDDLMGMATRSHMITVINRTSTQHKPSSGMGAKPANSRETFLTLSRSRKPPQQDNIVFQRTKSNLLGVRIRNKNDRARYLPSSLGSP
jgi:hypothetical protein